MSEKVSDAMRDTLAVMLRQSKRACDALVYINKRLYCDLITHSSRTYKYRVSIIIIIIGRHNLAIFVVHMIDAMRRRRRRNAYYNIYRTLFINILLLCTTELFFCSKRLRAPYTVNHISCRTEKKNYSVEKN